MKYKKFRSNVEKILPFNRKERFFTGTVLPSLLFHKGFDILFEFLQEVPGFPSDININTTKDNLLLYTEYNLKESDKKNMFHAKTGETPDAVILIQKPKPILILIEAKMYENVLPSELEKQIKAQKENVSDLIKSEQQLKDDQIYHVALIPKKLAEKFDKPKNYTIITWEYFLENPKIKDNHFYNYLKYALKKYKKLVSKAGASTVKGHKTGSEIFNQGKSSGIWIGRRGGKNQIAEDVASGRWKEFKYSTNTELPERGQKGNWIDVITFIDLVTTHKN